MFIAGRRFDRSRIAVADNTALVIIGAATGGLTLALALHQAGVSCRVFG